MPPAETTFDFLDAPSQPGDLGTLSHYRVIRELGRGGMGYVFHAEDKKLRREVAMKVMNRKVAATPFSRKRFLREARAMAAVHHDNVATIFEVGEKSGIPYMAMEMLKGSTLEALNENDQRLSYQEVIDYAKQITQGLAAAHAKGIVHRDIKPANIWVEEGSHRIKILDFGLALAETNVDELSGYGAVIGTPGYLSPEQARTEPLDDRSDLYSLGVVLYELCTGQLPLQSSTVAGQLIAILAHRPTPMLSVNPEIPIPLAELIHRLLFKEPRARIRSATKLVEELNRVSEECEAKSEVAQTINKLQQGLDKVVKQSTPVESEPVLDPFAAIPNIQLPAAPAPTPAAGIPVAPVPAPISGYARPRPAPTPSGAVWQRYVPLAIVAAVVCVALPLMTFAFSGMGRGKEAYVVGAAGQANQNAAGQTNQNSGAIRANAGSRDRAESDSTTNPTGQRNPNPNANRNSFQGAKSPNRNGNQQNNQGANNRNRQGQGKNRKNRGNNANRGGNNRGNNNANRGNNQPSSADKPVENSFTSSANSALMGNANPADPDSGMRPDEPGSSFNNPSLAMRSERNNASNATPRPGAKPELQWSTITTADGRGADTMVQIGTSQKFGTKPSMAIHARGRIDSHHAYLRFDLAAVKEVRHEAEQVELVLSVVGDKRPKGATLRLYGVDTQGLPMWMEEGALALTWAKTPSAQSLAGLPLLASVTVGEPDSRDSNGNKIRVSAPELTAFVREASTETVTLLVAGNSGSRTPLRVVSREGDASKAPSLQVKAPTEPTRRRRGRGGYGAAGP